MVSQDASISMFIETCLLHLPNIVVQQCCACEGYDIEDKLHYSLPLFMIYSSYQIKWKSFADAGLQVTVNGMQVIALINEYKQQSCPVKMIFIESTLFTVCN